MLSFHQLDAALMLKRENLCELLLYYFNLVAFEGLPLEYVDLEPSRADTEEVTANDNVFHRKK